jgi:hypothetical protein
LRLRGEPSLFDGSLNLGLREESRARKVTDLLAVTPDTKLDAASAHFAIG